MSSIQFSNDAGIDGLETVLDKMKGFTFHFKDDDLDVVVVIDKVESGLVTGHLWEDDEDYPNEDFFYIVLTDNTVATYL